VTRAQRPKDLLQLLACKVNLLRDRMSFFESRVGVGRSTRFESRGAPPAGKKRPFHVQPDREYPRPRRPLGIKPVSEAENLEKGFLNHVLSQIEVAQVLLGMNANLFGKAAKEVVKIWGRIFVTRSLRVARRTAGFRQSLG
jgi:hypothetical protein